MPKVTSRNIFWSTIDSTRVSTRTSQLLQWSVDENRNASLRQRHQFCAVSPCLRRWHIVKSDRKFVATARWSSRLQPLRLSPHGCLYTPCSSRSSNFVNTCARCSNRRRRNVRSSPCNTWRDFLARTAYWSPSKIPNSKKSTVRPGRTCECRAVRLCDQRCNTFASRSHPSSPSK